MVLFLHFSCIFYVPRPLDSSCGFFFPSLRAIYRRFSRQKASKPFTHELHIDAFEQIEFEVLHPLELSPDIVIRAVTLVQPIRHDDGGFHETQTLSRSFVSVRRPLVLARHPPTSAQEQVRAVSAWTRLRYHQLRALLSARRPCACSNCCPAVPDADLRDTAPSSPIRRG